MSLQVLPYRGVRAVYVAWLVLLSPNRQMAVALVEVLS